MPSPAFSRLLHAPLGLAALALLGCSSGGDRPNILLVTLDTTRPDFMSTYGYEPGHTPAFDSLAVEGARFDMAISASAVTPVSHASILTGAFPYRHGLRVLSAAGGFRLPDEATTLAQTLQDRGYHTAAIHSAFPVSAYFGFDRGFDVFESFEGAMHQGGGGTKTSWDTSKLQRRSDATTDLALEAARAADGPFFLWVHYWDPHDPTLVPPRAYLEGVAQTRDAIYAAEVHYMDAQFGRLLQGLKDDGTYEDTVIVVTADHGEGLMDGGQRHGWQAHRMVYQEQIRVPLLVRTPDGSGNREIADVVRTVDVAPTILDYAGVDVPDDLDGRSLRPLLEGRADEPRVAYADQINGYDFNASMVERRPDAKFLYCLVDGPWKLTYRPHMPDRSELFDLSKDPGEVQNLIADHPDVAERLLSDLAQRQPWVTRPFDPDPTADASVAELLQGLGYASGSGGGEDLEWSWTCPKHLFEHFDERGRHEGCGEILIPVSKP